MPTFEILCTTMHQDDFSKIEEMNVHSNIVYANQCDHTSYEEKEFEGHVAKMISTQTRGVGKNRNISLIYASADICLFADDDVIYMDDAEEKILAEFEAHPDADIMIFYFESNHPTRKPTRYSKTHKWTSAKRPWGAVRIAFRLQAVRKANLWFTTLFGGGCIFPSGEDSIWLNAARKAGLTLYVSDKTIGQVFYDTSSWFTGYDEKYFYGVGACYEAINSKTAWIKSIVRVFIDRKRGDLPNKQKLKWIENGRKGYRTMTPFSKDSENL